MAQHAMTAKPLMNFRITVFLRMKLADKMRADVIVQRRLV
jgi:hypothetical protein